jgi:hypothetical protein
VLGVIRCIGFCDTIWKFVKEKEREMSDVDRVIEAIEELPLTASINDLMTYLPGVFTGQDVSRNAGNPVYSEEEWREASEPQCQEVDNEAVLPILDMDRQGQKKAITRPETHDRKT